jgi:hypothetical protein
MGSQSAASSLVQSVDPMIADDPFSHGYLCSASSEGFKLRLTTRLRDCLASEKYSVLAMQAESFFNICEADVLPVHHEHLADDEDGTNSRVPSWEFGNFYRLWNCMTLRTTLSFWSYTETTEAKNQRNLTMFRWHSLGSH